MPAGSRRRPDGPAPESVSSQALHRGAGVEAWQRAASRSASGSSDQAVLGERRVRADHVVGEEELDVFLEARDDADVGLLDVEEERAARPGTRPRRWSRSRGRCRRRSRPSACRHCSRRRRGRRRRRPVLLAVDAGQGLGVVAVDVDGLAVLADARRRPCSRRRSAMPAAVDGVGLSQPPSAAWSRRLRGCRASRRGCRRRSPSPGAPDRLRTTLV